MLRTRILHRRVLCLIFSSVFLVTVSGLTAPSRIRGRQNLSFSGNFPKTSVKSVPNDSYDVVVVGSGIGGLSCAAMLSKYGYSVGVFEAHYSPGGAAHGFTVRHKDIGDFRFDTGPSFFSGLNPDLPAKSSNPLRTVLDAIDEPVKCAQYTTFGLLLPEGEFIHSNRFGKPGGVIEKLDGVSGSKSWSKMMQNMGPLAKAVDALPTIALRGDIGMVLTAAPYIANFATLNPLENFKLTKPFQTILRNSGIDPASFSSRWLDLLCFCLSGLPADGTITAEMAMMMGEFYDDEAIMDCPVGGSKAIVDALVRGIEKQGGSVFVNAPVGKILVENGTAWGVRLSKKDYVVKAKQAVISNLSVWDLYGSEIIENSAFSDTFLQKRMETPIGKSFMHLHVGFRASKEELSKLQAHYIYIDDWSRGVEGEDNAVLLSIPSVHDDSLAPDGYGVLHIYTPATEDFSRWEGLDRNSDEYKILKEERSQYLWQVLEKIIPAIKEKVVVSQVGTPLTHRRFLNRYRGSYGPAIRAGESSFPFPVGHLMNGRVKAFDTIVSSRIFDGPFICCFIASLHSQRRRKLHPSISKVTVNQASSLQSWCRIAEFCCQNKDVIVTSPSDNDHDENEGRYDMNSPREWLEFCEKEHNQHIPFMDRWDGDPYTVVRCEFSRASGKWKIWGFDFHLRRLKNSLEMLKHGTDFIVSPSVDELGNFTLILLTNLIERAQKAVYNDVVVMVTLLWEITENSSSPCNKVGIKVRGHAFSSLRPTDFHENIPETPVQIVLGCMPKSESLTLPRRFDRFPNAKLSSWCRERRPLENRFKVSNVGEVILTRGFSDDLESLELLEGLTSNIFVVSKERVLLTPPSKVVLGGYVRQMIVDNAEECGYRVEIGQLRAIDASTWEEVFLTSSIRLIVPVSAIFIPTVIDANGCLLEMEKLWEAPRTSQSNGNRKASEVLYQFLHEDPRFVTNSSER